MIRFPAWMASYIEFGSRPNKEQPQSKCINWPDALCASPATIVLFFVLILQFASILILLFGCWWSMNAVLDVNFVCEVLGRCVDNHFENPWNQDQNWSVNEEDVENRQVCINIISWAGEHVVSILFHPHDEKLVDQIESIWYFTQKLHRPRSENPLGPLGS